jgi:hypothetical protein
VAEKPAEGPVYGLPGLGDVDFTPKGAKLLRKIVKAMFGPSWNAEAVYKNEWPRREEFYMRTQRAAKQVLIDIKRRNDVISVSGPSPIGRWRVYWWECYPKGYRITVKTGRSWQ